MNIRDIDSFLKVYECRSINIAAEKLYITPQGLSTIIRRLEEELNCTLFNRDRAGSAPTECGEIFYKYAQNIKRDYQSMTSEINRASREKQGVIRFGYSFGAMTGLALDFPLRFHELYPAYTLEYSELPDYSIEELIDKGELDVGVASCDDTDSYNTTLVYEANILFVPHSKSKFIDRDSVSIAEIAGEPLTLRESTFTTTRIMMREFEKCGKKPNIVFNTGGILSSIKMCRDNRANTVILDNVAKQFSAEDFRTIPFREGIKWPLHIITKGERKNKAVNSFIGFLTENLHF